MILQRYILRELIASFIFSFCTVLAVCLIGTMFQVFRTFPGVGFEILAKALPMATGAMASWVMLVAACTSSTLVYARLAAENEITAMRTCGIHVWRIISPAILLGLLLVGMAYPLNEIVVPWTRYNRLAMFRDSTLHLLKMPPAGQHDFKIGLMRISYLDYQGGRMKEPTISKYKINSEATLVVVMEWFAESGSIEVHGEEIRVVLTRPRVWQLNDKGQEERFSAENDVKFVIPPDDLGKAQRKPPDQPAGWLWDQLSKTSDPAARNPLLLILHTRYGSSLAPMLLVLVAMPIGILVRRGSRLAGLGAALPPLLIYFVSYFIFQGLGDKNRVHPLVAAYAPDLFLAALASMLLWGVSRR
jgi:lipopolysaccharide export system permease protein